VRDTAKSYRTRLSGLPDLNAQGYIGVSQGEPLEGRGIAVLEKANVEFLKLTDLCKDIAVENRREDSYFLDQRL
jgi:hypothetical protein